MQTTRQSRAHVRNLDEVRVGAHLMCSLKSIQCPTESYAYCQHASQGHETSQFCHCNKLTTGWSCYNCKTQTFRKKSNPLGCKAAYVFTCTVVQSNCNLKFWQGVRSFQLSVQAFAVLSEPTTNWLDMFRSLLQFATVYHAILTCAVCTG